MPEISSKITRHFPSKIWQAQGLTLSPSKEKPHGEHRTMKKQLQRPLHMSLWTASAVLAAAALIGCHKGSDLVGKWQGTMPYVASKTMPMEVEYKADGTVTQTVSSHGRTMVIHGTYTAKDGTLTESNMSFTVNGHSMPMPGTDTSKYKIDGDTLTLTQSNIQPTVLHREKS